MGFSFPKLPAIHPPSTLAKAVQKPSLTTMLPVLAAVSPLGFVAYEVSQHPDQVKSTLSSAADDVKKAAPVVANSLGKAGHAVAGVASAGFNTIMMPLMVVGGLVVAMLVLKK